MRRALFLVLATIAFATPLFAQEAFVSAGAGLVAGTGGPGGAFQVAGGYTFSERFGLQVEVNGDFNRDFGRFQPSIPSSLISILDTPVPFPNLYAEYHGRVLTFTTSAVAPIVSTRKVRIDALAGGGVATLRTTTHVHMDPLQFPVIPGFPDFSRPALDTTSTGSDTGLALGGGGRVEYLVTARVGMAAAVRYDHVFTTRKLDLVRPSFSLMLHF